MCLEESRLWKWKSIICEVVGMLARLALNICSYVNVNGEQVRGCSYMFGYHAVQRFLRDNRLMYMVRAHEVQEEGFRSHFPR